MDQLRRTPSRRRTDPPDRIRSAIRILIIVACLCAFPVAGAVAIRTAATAVDRIEASNATKSLVTATVAAQPRVVAAQRVAVARVRWIRDGRSGAALAPVTTTAVRGDMVEVWLGADTAPTAPPADPSGALSAGLRAAAAVLLGTWAMSALATWATDRCLRHHHNTQRKTW
ncbi:hypothetical protein ACQP2U_07905 [Nocardia sp. CA-084685]|uniref:hypothetical protein n=1 Tax=Nocardia sp. CA-084685 TaxID=3239970 RepID=UPI003D99E2F1